jgi:hypothetical protein
MSDSDEIRHGSDRKRSDRLTWGHPIEILNHLNQIERHRDLLMNIHELHHQCQQLIETMHGLGLLG